MIAFFPSETVKNSLYDTVNLRYEADYQIQVADDVYWIPVNQLGKTRYTNGDIKKLLCLPPEDKQNKIETLYEAIQLYQASNFRGVMDNEPHTIGNISWHYHKPGFHAVRTNEGCCASDSNWLAYILAGSYEQMVFIHYSQRDTNGHIMNYIYHSGWYYFIDMMMYRSDSLQFAGSETGTAEGYRDNELIAGNFFKSRLPISYVNYCLRKHREAPILFTFSIEKEVYVMAVDGQAGLFDILHPSNMHTVILYKDKDFGGTVKYVEPFRFTGKWDDIPTDEYKQDQSL